MIKFDYNSEIISVQFETMNMYQYYVESTTALRVMKVFFLCAAKSKVFLIKIKLSLHEE